MKHTPGPWKLHGKTIKAFYLKPCAIAQIKAHAGDSLLWDKMDEANTKLIAAAPLLLEKLINLVNDYEQAVGIEEIEENKDSYKEFFEAVEAIAAATE